MSHRVAMFSISSLLRRKLQTLGRLTWQQRWMWLEAWMYLGLARWLVLHVPLKQIAPYLGTHGGKSEPMLTLAGVAIARQVSWAIRRAARNTPWNSNCLACAITAKRMLQKRKLSSTLYLGVRKDESGKLQAHAWVRCGALWVTGKQGHRQYTVVSTFADA